MSRQNPSRTTPGRRRVDLIVWPILWRLAPVTSFTWIDGHIVAVDYAEPAADLVPPKKSRVLFRPGA